ncbi:MAG TPA: hypothetical protein VFV81_05365 [Verrucomicrobiae bacterium]|nr:hypothetical protein [Verrucomicrobiae bacterium]
MKARSEISGEEKAAPCLLWFRTWRGVYLFVIGCFIVYLVLLIALSRAFS